MTFLPSVFKRDMAPCDRTFVKRKTMPSRLIITPQFQWHHFDLIRSRNHCVLGVLYGTLIISILFWDSYIRSCQKNVGVCKRFFSTTTYAAIPLLGMFLCKALKYPQPV